MINSVRILSLCLILMLGALSACEKPPEVTVSVDKEDYSPEEQKEVGDNFVAYLESTGAYNILDKAEHMEVYNYLEQLWASAVNNQMIESRLAFDWEIFVVKNDDIKTAFSLPGGKIYLYTGLLKLINNESELFGILAHELYYIDRGAALQAMIDEYGTLIVGELWLNSDNSGVKNLVETIYQLQIPVHEVLQADKFAIDLVCPFRYNPKGLRSFLEMAYSMDQLIDWLNTRPGSEERLIKMDEMGHNCGSEEFTFSERYAQYKAMLP